MLCIKSQALRHIYPRRSGVTFVEVLVAGVVLMVIVSGSVAYVYHSRLAISTDQNKRLALEALNSRLEDIWAQGYDLLQTYMQPFGFEIYTPLELAGQWDRNGSSEQIVATLQYVDVGVEDWDDDGAPPCIRIVVSTHYGEGPGDDLYSLTLTTLCFQQG